MALSAAPSFSLDETLQIAQRFTVISEESLCLGRLLAKWPWLIGQYHLRWSLSFCALNQGVCFPVDILDGARTPDIPL